MSIENKTPNGLSLNPDHRLSKEIKTNLFTETPMSIENKTPNGSSLNPVESALHNTTTEVMLM